MDRVVEGVSAATIQQLKVHSKYSYYVCLHMQVQIFMPVVVIKQ